MRNGHSLSDEFTKSAKYSSIEYNREQEGSCVYLFLNNKTGFTKIGYTTMLKIRIRTIELSSGNPVSLIAAIYPENGYKPKAKDIEKYLHNYFQKKRVIGEWFNLSVRDIIQVARLFIAIDAGNGMLFSEFGNCNPFSKGIKNRFVKFQKQAYLCNA
jgi:hypothetical protein